MLRGGERDCWQTWWNREYETDRDGRAESVELRLRYLLCCPSLSLSLFPLCVCVCISLCTHIRSNFLSGSRLSLCICTPDGLYSSLGPAPNSFSFVFSFILDVVRIISSRRRRLYTTKWYWGQKSDGACVALSLCLCVSQTPPWWWRSYIIIIQHCICCWCWARMNLFSFILANVIINTRTGKKKERSRSSIYGRPVFSCLCVCVQWDESLR